MRTEERLSERACTVGFVEVACPRCLPGDTRCSNCGGTRRLWRDGPATLSDAGLERLLAMHARMVLAGSPSPFHQRYLSVIHWPSRTLHASF